MRLGLFILFAILFYSCSNSVGTGPSGDVFEKCVTEPLSGMLCIDSRDSQVALGTNDMLARPNERPQMQVNFDYAFSIGRHEVTCGEFNSLMKPGIGLSLECAGDNVPATNLTYFDAVLFANARSKAEGFDTVYTYASSVFDRDNHCTSLEGFAYHPEVDGYRLPTEAEWVYVAGIYSDETGWTAANSNNELHDVCTATAKKDRPCDMVGNAMEWVNDWLGYFSDTTITDYVGDADGGTHGQRILKGGSYRHSQESITLYGRGDVYSVTSSTRTEYVGFRLAFGKIPNAVWTKDGNKVVQSRIIPLANSTTIRSFTRTYKVKLAFRNDMSGNIAFIDYSDGNLSVIEIADSIDAYHPDVSPDGKKVAFCTGLEGISGKSSLYVRNLDAEGSALVKLDVESAAIPRWRVLENGDTVIVYVTDAGNNKDEIAFKSASTWQVKFVNGKFGTPEKLFDGAFHGGISEDDMLAVTGGRLLRARVAESSSSLTGNAFDSLWYNGEQACNASLSKDSTKRTIFLDFGGKTGHDFVGENYGTHERLLVADASGRLTQSIAAPAGYSFDHCEWSLGRDNLAVATLTNANGTHSKIVLINLSDSNVVGLVEGEELWHPSLWVNGNVSAADSSMLDLDSAGVYLVEGASDRSIILRYRMELLWMCRDSVEVLGLGGSRMSNGFNPSLLNSYYGLNLSYFPSHISDVLHFSDRYVFGRFPKLKYILVSLDIDYWNTPPETSFFYEEYQSYPGYVYDEHHHFGADFPTALLYEATSLSMGVDVYRSMFLNNRSSQFAETNGWGGENPVVDKDSCWMDTERFLYEKTLDMLREIIEKAGEENVTVIGIVFPQAPGYKNTGAIGRHGLRRSDAVGVLNDLKNLQNIYQNFIFVDENKMGNHDYGDEMAQDEDHLNNAGGAHFTARLDSLLQAVK